MTAPIAARSGEIASSCGYKVWNPQIRPAPNTRPRVSKAINSSPSRLDPARYAGLAEGDAHVIRNAGGRASDDAFARS